MTRIVARLDPTLEPVVSELAPLVYAGGGSAAQDVPPHVRAASALRRRGARLVIVQDDVNVLALHGDDGAIEPVLLPLGPGGRRSFSDAAGNKHAKMDLEACALLPDGRLLALGSGSTRAREQLVVLDPAGTLRGVGASALYAALRAEPRFAGSELNVEGAAVAGDALRLFQRGNGAPTDSAQPVNATADLDLAELLAWLDGTAAEPPAPRRIRQYELGRAAGAPFSFTDAAALSDGRVAFIACAEASPDAVRDGAVLGCRFGLLDDDGARIADIHDPDGRPTTLKLEGLEPRPSSPDAFDVVADVDRADQPALLGTLRVCASAV